MTKSTKRKEDQRRVVHIFANRGAQVREEPTRLDIKRRAYEIYLVRGGAEVTQSTIGCRQRKNFLARPLKFNEYPTIVFSEYRSLTKVT